MTESSVATAMDRAAASDELFFPSPRLELKAAWHPLHDAIEQQLAVDNYSYLLRHCGNEQAARRFLSQRIPAYGGLCYPNALDERIYAIEQLMNAVTLMDDAFTAFARDGNQPGLDALRGDFIAAIDGKCPSPDTPSAQLLYETLRLMDGVRTSRPRFWQRFIGCIGEQIDMQANPSAIDVAHLSFNEYLQLRHVEGFGHWITLTTEYALDVDMGDLLDESLIAVRDAAIDSVILVNDLFSFRKESSSSETLNAVWILMRVEQLDTQAAICRLAELCELNERRLIDAQNSVAASALGQRADVRAYIAELGHMSAGNAEFHRFSTRYHAEECDSG
ncbi:terpene synthase family protein [Burkholderia singularis]|uniref:terpene synthase family protein n=1 Tax=Burkholderia singularis TaxID=1503053 RepID=UPI000A3E9F42|nr:methyltransferase type 12 [Burkholderia singularis]